MHIALYALMTYESFYLDEWIEYYRSLGVDDFYISQHIPWKFTGKNREAADVHLEEHSRAERQDFLFNRFLSKPEIQKKYDWTLFFDIDEFLVLKNGDASLKQFLEKFSSSNGIAFNWKIFGSKTDLEDQDAPVLERFIHCRKSLSKTVKLALNLKNITSGCKFSGPHEVYIGDGFGNFLDVDDPSGKKHQWNTFDEDRIDFENKDYAWLAHFMTKTRSEFDKKLKAFLDGPGFDRTDYFDAVNKDANEAIDTSARDFMRYGKFG